MALEWSPVFAFTYVLHTFKPNLCLPIPMLMSQNQTDAIAEGTSYPKIPAKVKRLPHIMLLPRPIQTSLTRCWLDLLPHELGINTFSCILCVFADISPGDTAHFSRSTSENFAMLANPVQTEEGQYPKVF